MMKMTDITGLNSHNFTDYIMHDSFRKILNDYGVQTVSSKSN